MNDILKQQAVVLSEDPLIVLLPPSDLPEEDGEPLETNWHRLAMNLLIEGLGYHWRDRHDFFVGGNMFVYFSEDQIRSDSYRGPDFFVALDVDRAKPRRYWATWLENGRYPDVIVELISPKTEKVDRTTKKKLYERTFGTWEYFLYDPEKELLEGWRLGDKGRYRALKPDNRGWFWSEKLSLWLGKWTGHYLEVPGVYPRFFDTEGNLVLIGREAEEKRAEAARQQAEAAKQQAEAAKQQAEAAKQQAEVEKQRAEAAEAELARLRARLAELEAKEKKD